MAFSGALTLTDLNDFITPSQACIKPVEQLNPSKQKLPDAASTEIHIDGSGSYYEVSTESNQATQGKKLEQAQISLNDCLACSGCITSAESVLITLQSHKEVFNFLESNSNPPPSEHSKIPIISISPQSLASLAAALATTNQASSSQPPITPRQVLRRVRAFCIQSLGFAHVFDTTFARHIALREHIKEFEERRASVPAYSSGGKGHTGSADTGGWGPHALPMLASACPGWICYAEKAHGEMLPFIARTKSPQQVMGTLVKHWMGQVWGKLPNEIYHVSVMPCYDKKLEASRKDFYDDVYSTRDVDCVITTGELELMMREKGWDISLPVPGELDPVPSPSPSPTPPSPYTSPENISNLAIISPPLPTPMPELLTHPGTSSGSYLHAIIAHLQATSPIPLVLSTKTVRNADYEEYALRKRVDPGMSEVNGVHVNGNGVNGVRHIRGNNGVEYRPTRDQEHLGEIVFKGAKCYGFRNLQNVVRKVGRERGVRTTSGAAGKLGGPRASGAGVGVGARRLRKGRGGVTEKEQEEERGYDYVEVMACPGGCVNGGGQLKPVLHSNGTGTGVDEEGYTRDWEGNGVAIGDEVNVLQNAKWGDREWTKKVEEMYWRDRDDISHHLDADVLMERVWDELVCRDEGMEVDGDGDGDKREERRRLFFRTQYRAVESEVVGLAVVW